MRTPLVVAVIAAGLASTGGSRLTAQEPSSQNSSTDRAIVVDAPDIQKLQLGSDPTFMSDVVGLDVYGNGGAKIGTVKDFVVADGSLFAVLDTSNGPLDGTIDQSAEEEIVVPWNELRRADMSQM